MSKLKATLWMIPGAAIMLVVGLIAVLSGQASSAQQLALRTKRVDWASHMQLELSSASEAEKSAVMAVTDEESQTFADQARAHTANVDRDRQELEASLATGGSPKEKELLAQFSQAFAEFKRIDSDLLALAVKNTNIKAYGLAFGPAAQAVQDMNDALDKVTAAGTGTPDAAKIALLALKAETSALRIQTLLAPHIAEESDAKMDQLEASMQKEEKELLGALDALAALPRLKTNPDLATARSSYGGFVELRKQILALSRENTNVRSLAISLTQKRKAESLCQDALSALKQAVLEEPVRALPVSPR